MANHRGSGAYGPGQTLESIFLVKDRKRLGVHAAGRQVIQPWQAGNPAIKVAVGLDSQQLARGWQPVECFLQAVANGARDGVGIGDHAGQRAVLLQPLGGGLGPDLGHARHVVDDVTDQRLKVDHPVRRHAKLGLDPGDVAPLAVHGVDNGDVGIDQLRQVLVATAHNHLDALAGRNLRQRANHIVSLDAGNVQHLPAHQAHHLMDRHNLCAQVVGHGRALRLVLRVQRIAKGRSPGVKHTGRKIRRKFLAQTLQHVDHAANGARRRAGGIARDGAQVGHGMKGAIQVAGPVHQKQAFFHRCGVVHDPILPAAGWPPVVLQLAHEICTVVRPVPDVCRPLPGAGSSARTDSGRRQNGSGCRQARGGRAAHRKDPRRRRRLEHR